MIPDHAIGGAFGERTLHTDYIKLFIAFVRWGSDDLRQ